MTLCRIYNNQGLELAHFNLEDFSNSFRIGRAEDCEVSLHGTADRNVSREHLLGRKVNGEWKLYAKGKSGMWLNGDDVTALTIKEGIVVRFSQLFLCIGENCMPSGYLCTWDAETEDHNHRAVLWPGINTIGASRDNYVTVRTEDVSRVHARITVSTNGKIHVESLYKGRYTAVNDVPLNDDVRELHADDILTLGETNVKITRPPVLPKATQLSLDELRRNTMQEQQRKKTASIRSSQKQKTILIGAFAIFILGIIVYLLVR